MAIEDSIHLDAQRLAAAVNFIYDLNNKINWNVVGPLLIGALFLALILYRNRGSIAYYWARTPLALAWEKRRMEKDRRKKVNELISDGVVEAIEDLYYTNQITKAERKEAYFDLGRKGYPDLLTVAQQTQILEDEQKKEEDKNQIEPSKVRYVHIM